LNKLSPEAWKELPGRSVKIRGYVPGEAVKCKVIIMNIALGKYGGDYFQHIFCVDPRQDYKIIFGNDLAIGLAAIYDHLAGLVTFREIPGRKKHLRLPLIPTSKMQRSRSYLKH
jgi:hypothetical protein